MAKQEDISICKDLRKETIQDINWCVTTWSSVLNDSGTHDVIFKACDGGSVSGHRAIVGAGSPVFHAMLYGNMKESTEREIELPSVDTKSLKILLSFIYTGKVEVDSKNCLTILEAAHYFDVAKLETKCADYIATLLDTENCCIIATFAYDKKLNVLLEKCYQFMYSNGHKVIEGASFKTLPSELMLKFCQSSDLCIKEINLFIAVTKWYQHQKMNIPDITVKTIFKQIRYPLISISDLLEKVRPSELADSILYTSALEFHLMPNKYNGPKIQLIRRSSLDFNVVNRTTNTMTVNKEGPFVSITKTSSSNDWNGLCAVQVCPTEQHPVHFKFTLKHSHRDQSGIYMDVKSCSESSLVASVYSITGGVDGTGFTKGEEVDGLISMKESRITATIGHKTISTTAKQNRMIYFGVHLYYVDNSVSIFMLS